MSVVTDGSFGPATRAAAKLFQHASGLSEDGVVGPKTLIEGNTNDSGSPEGCEVCRRLRGCDQKDFILMTAGEAGKTFGLRAR